MSTEGKMSLMDWLDRGLRFQVAGKIGDWLRIEDPKSGEISRFVRILGFGRTYNLTVDTDEELARYKELEGSQARASGKLGRRRGASAATAKVDTIAIPGVKGWTDLTDAEIREGCKYDGVGIVTDKKFSEFRGETYRSMQLGLMGETFLFRGIAPAIFDTIPDDGPIKVSGHLDAKVVSSANGMISDLLLQLEEVKVLSQPAERPERPQEERKPA